MKQLYAMYDVKARSYGPIFSVGHDAVAVREFGAACGAQGSVLFSYPDDFELHRVGSFDDDGEEVSMPVMGCVTTVVISARQWMDAQPKAVQDVV